MTDVVLIRGLPGSGKTTYAKKHFSSHVLIEEDDYFMIGDEYFFDHGKLADAHKWCQWRFDQLVKVGQPVVVANTFTRYWEMKHYLLAAPNAKVIRCTGEWPNTHGVPVEAVQRMRDRFEDLLGETYAH